MLNCAAQFTALEKCEWMDLVPYPLTFLSGSLLSSNAEEREAQRASGRRRPWGIFMLIRSTASLALVLEYLAWLQHFAETFTLQSKMDKDHYRGAKANGAITEEC